MYGSRLLVRQSSALGLNMEWRVNKSTSAVKVLVVDDETLIVEELCEFLESSGYVCIPCGSGQQAIECFSEDADIGLVLCDLHMPDMDGIEQRLHAALAA